MPSVVVHKVCRGCKRELPLSEFHRNENYPDGRLNKCRRCMYKKYGHNYVKVYLCASRIDKSVPLAIALNRMFVTKARLLVDRLLETQRITLDQHVELLGQLREEGIFDANRTTRRSTGPTALGHSG